MCVFFIIVNSASAVLSAAPSKLFFRIYAKCFLPSESLNSAVNEQIGAENNVEVSASGHISGATPFVLETLFRSLNSKMNN